MTNSDLGTYNLNCDVKQEFAILPLLQRKTSTSRRSESPMSQALHFAAFFSAFLFVPIFKVETIFSISWLAISETSCQSEVMEFWPTRYRYEAIAAQKVSSHPSGERSVHCVDSTPVHSLIEVCQIRLHSARPALRLAHGPILNIPGQLTRLASVRSNCWIQTATSGTRT